jgi:hypothetical protein
MCNYQLCALRYITFYMVYAVVGGGTLQFVAACVRLLSVHAIC